MNFDEIKERLAAEWAKFLENIQENRIYNEIKDRFQNLTPLQQRLSLIGGVAFFVFILFSIPYSYYSTSQEAMAEFTETRQLIRDLLKTAKEVKEAPEIPVAPPVESIKGRIESYLQSSQLLPEQILGTNIENPQGGVVNSQLVSGGIRVALSQLNLRQIIDFGLEFSNLDTSVKLKDMEISASTKEAGYFDVIYKILVLKVNVKEAPPEEEKPKKKGN